MKIAFAIVKYHPFGGLQRDCLRIAEYCVAAGHDVTLFTSKWEGPRPDKIKLRFIMPKGWSNHRKMENFASQVLAQKSSFDCLIGFNRMPGLDVFYAGESCYVAGIHQHKSWWYRLQNRYRVYKRMEEGVYGHNSQTQALILSPTEAALLQPHYPDCQSRLHFIKPGIQKERFLFSKKHVIRKQLRDELDIKQFMLLMVGSDFIRKGVDRTILAIAQLPETIKHQTTLVVLGKGDVKKQSRLCEQYQLQDQVKFLGGVENAIDYLFAADVLCHPARLENTGTVIIEALVAGLPMIVTANCGYACYVNDAKAGAVLADPFTQDNFNQTLSALLQQDLQRCQHNIQQYTDQHDLFSLEASVLAEIEKVKT